MEPSAKPAAIVSRVSLTSWGITESKSWKGAKPARRRKAYRRFTSHVCIDDVDDSGGDQFHCAGDQAGLCFGTVPHWSLSTPMQ